MKKLTSVILMLALVLSSAGCSKGNINEDAQAFLEDTSGIESQGVEKASMPQLHIGLTRGVGVLSALSLLKTSDNENVSFEIIDDLSQFNGSSENEKYNVLLVPSHLAAVLYNRNQDYKLIGSTVWSSASIVSNNETQTWDSLKGQTISLMGEGQPLDAVLRAVLDFNGLVPNEDVDLNYLTDLKALQAGVVKGRSLYVLISEPQLSTVLRRNENAGVVLDLSQEWNNMTGSTYGIPQVSVLVSSEIIEQHPMLTKLLIERLFESAAWVKDESKLAADYADSIDIGIERNLIKRQIDTLNIEFVPVGANTDVYDVYYNTLFDFSESLVGGDVPSKEFYFIPPKRP